MVNQNPATPHAPASRELADAVRRLTLQVSSYVGAVARRTGHHTADLHAVSAVRHAAEQGHPLGAGDLGRTLGLSPAAVSAMLDRMERSGHVRRTRADEDARRVQLEPTEQSVRDSRELFAPLTAGYAQTLADYSPEQLALVTEVLERLQQATHDAEQTVGRTPRPS